MTAVSSLVTFLPHSTKLITAIPAGALRTAVPARSGSLEIFAVRLSCTLPPSNEGVEEVVPEVIVSGRGWEEWPHLWVRLNKKEREENEKKGNMRNAKEINILVNFCFKAKNRF